MEANYDPIYTRTPETQVVILKRKPMKYLRCRIDSEFKRGENVWQVMDDNYNFVTLVYDDGSPAKEVTEYTAIENDAVPPSALLNL